MDLGLTGKLALVTAASGGLGYAIARELAAEGARVVVAGRHAERIEAAAASIRGATGGAVDGRVADCTKVADIDRLVAETEAHIGGIDILINNSGGPPSAPFTELSDQGWLDAFNAKFLPQVRAARAVLPLMAARKGGRIVTIVGTHGRTPHGFAITAGVVNAALLNLTKALADLGAPDNVLVNAINPGPIDTDRMRYIVTTQATMYGISEAESKRRLVAEVQLGRFGDAADIAAAAVFLVSARAGFITGALLDVDGGLTRSL